MKKVDCHDFLLNVKMRDRTTNYQRNRKRILNRAKKYKNNKQVLREKAKNKYIKKELSEEEKSIKRECGRKK